MNKAIEKLIKGGEKNYHVFPFFWQHGEDEETLRKYVGVIQEAGCDAFCVESRPHPDFCGPKWWQDMDAILDEAKSRNMKVWILDDSHFPTGYCNGAVENAPVELCRQNLFSHVLKYKGGAKAVKLPLDKLKKPPKYKMNLMQTAIMKTQSKGRKFDDDGVFSVTAFGPDGQVELVEGDVWQKPEGEWEVYVCGLSRNIGSHKNYMNMMDKESCRLLIDNVYEPHWEHYKDYFGDTILGFFSDEPELGNGIIYSFHNTLGTDQSLPWSRELEEKLGDEFKIKLPLLWKNDFDGEVTAKARVEYMNAVTQLVQEDFSEQVGGWCRDHGVMYIGHVIEDSNTHACTGASLGHYFRGLHGQDMAGIDNIGRQVEPNTEDVLDPPGPFSGGRDGAFFHYTLGKLASSAAYLEDRKAGRSMCEIYGASGWGLGVSSMKYQADHFLVRGINHFVPHAFSPMKFPDPDCPPHFYAHGHNPQYRHCGEIFRYMGRVGSLFSDGKIITRVAILYNAEAEWADGSSMLPQAIGRLLYDNQIDYTILPIDYIAKAKDFDVVIVPEAKFLPEVVNKLKNALYVNSLPAGFTGDVTKPENIVPYLKAKKVTDYVLKPESDRIRIMHYKRGDDMFMIVNEGTERFKGTVTLPLSGPYYAYNAWDNCIEKVISSGKEVFLSLDPRKSTIIVCGKAEGRDPVLQMGAPTELKNWRRSTAASLEYPNFTGRRLVTLPDKLEEEQPKFSGFARYESSFTPEKGCRYVLEIEKSADGVEVFVNGVSQGIQVTAPYLYDITGSLKEAKNDLRIETASTAAREVESMTSGGLQGFFMPTLPPGDTGITGKVILWKDKK